MPLTIANIMLAPHRAHSSQPRGRAGVKKKSRYHILVTTGETIPNKTSAWRRHTKPVNKPSRRYTRCRQGAFNPRAMTAPIPIL